MASRIPSSFVAFDLETTGFRPPACKIIEIGAVKVRNGVLEETYQSLVNPLVEIPIHITTLTGIDNFMVALERSIDIVLPEFLQFSEGLPLAAHNAGFDMSFLKADAAELGLSLPHHIIDTVPLSRILFPTLMNHKLGTVAAHMGKIQQKAHRGLDDALVVAHILLRALEYSL